MPRFFVGLVVAAGFAVLAGCGYRQTTNCPTPASQGINTRDVYDPPAQAEAEELASVERFEKAAALVGARVKQELAKEAPPGRPPRNVLILSGGGSFGAYSAGVLVGWTQCGGRPCFDVVTGISTGALIAPFAFLGPKYDAQMQQFYTTITARDIFRITPLQAVFGEAFATSAPLRRKIDELLTPEAMQDLADAHRAGRRLYIGTTEEEGKRFVVWDVSGMAARNGPGDRDLIVNVLVGSASAPGLVPASKIDVSIDGVCHTERHVDGGVSQALFFRPPYVPPEQRALPGATNLLGTRVWTIVAGKVYADPEVIRPRALTQASRSVSTIIYAQTRGDLQRLYTYCLLSGMDYYVSAIPPEYPAPVSSSEFKPEVMSALFEEGRRVVCSPKAWRTTPPGVSKEEGETVLERYGTCLTHDPMGRPQLPIQGPRGRTVPPRYPTADRIAIPAVPMTELR